MRDVGQARGRARRASGCTAAGDGAELSQLGDSPSQTLGGHAGHLGPLPPLGGIVEHALAREQLGRQLKSRGGRAQLMSKEASVYLIWR